MRNVKRFNSDFERRFNMRRNFFDTIFPFIFGFMFLFVIAGLIAGVYFNVECYKSGDPKSMACYMAASHSENLRILEDR